MNCVEIVPLISEQTIQDVWCCIKLHEEKRIPVPPTSCFKAHSATIFALCCELFAMISPLHIKINLKKVWLECQFNEYYCPCGAILATCANF